MTTPPAPGSGDGWSAPGSDGSGWGPAPEAPAAAGAPRRDASAPGPPASPGWGQLSGAAPQRYGSVLSRRGIIALKPLGFGDFFDGAFRAIRHNPRAMIGLSALVLGVTNLLVAIPLGTLFTTPAFSGTGTEEPTTEELAGVLGSFVALVPLTFLQGIAITVLTGILILSVTQSVVDRRLSIGELWQRARGRVWPLIGWSVLVSVVGTLVFAAALVPGIVLLALDDIASGLVTTIVGGLAVAALLVWLYVRLVFVSVLIVVERLGIAASARRSFVLTRGAFWWTLLVVFLAGLLASIVSQLLSTPFALVGTLGLFLQETQPVLGAAVYVGSVALGSTVGFVLATPFLAGVIALLYVDRRIRLEGLDVALARTLEDGQE